MDTKLTVLRIINAIISLTIVGTWYFSRNWVLNNLIAFAMASAFVKIVQLNKIDPALIFLWLLFVYDIFWVFVSPYVFPQGKSVMVEVATSFDIPNKLIMPALLNRETGRTAMLGLGDVVIPGLYLTYLHNRK